MRAGVSALRARIPHATASRWRVRRGRRPPVRRVKPRLEPHEAHPSRAGSRPPCSARTCQSNPTRSSRATGDWFIASSRTFPARTARDRTPAACIESPPRDRADPRGPTAGRTAVPLEAPRSLRGFPLFQPRFQFNRPGWRPPACPRLAASPAVRAFCPRSAVCRSRTRNGGVRHMPVVHLLGTGAGVSGPERTTTMLAFESGGHSVVVDCGGDVIQRLLASRRGPGRHRGVHRHARAPGPRERLCAVHGEDLAAAAAVIPSPCTASARRWTRPGACGRRSTPAAGRASPRSSGIRCATSPAPRC